MTSPTPKLSVIVPTYCEAENLHILVPLIDNAVTQAGISAEIIIVDDNSPDDTQAVCDELSLTYPVRLHVRKEERGLSSAVIAGMNLARGDVLLVMDADLSHPPAKIPELVEALKDPEVDFVIGSRYVAGGETADDWGLFRWFNSKVSTLLAKPLTSACDPMAGFFCLRRTTFLSAAETLNPIGYKIGLELIVKCHCQNVAEVPISFSDRMHGESKLNVREQWNYLRHLKRLYEYRFREKAFFAQFALVGVSGMLVDFMAFALLLLTLSTPVARAFAIWVAMTWNFWLNRNVTFSYARAHSVLRQYLGFCGSCFLGAVINWSASMALCTWIAYFTEHKLIAALVGVLAGTVSNYLICRHFVFGSQSDTLQKTQVTPVSTALTADQALPEESDVVLSET
ncbi:MAG: glycosyltransferase family 2 protein [Planctomycetes bacterium]|nr:glycosyltransferase family 2 protein [Planctomycetota bacterium]